MAEVHTAAPDIHPCCHPTSAGVHPRSGWNGRADDCHGYHSVALGFDVWNLFFRPRLHTLPERMAHKSHKLQFEIVAVLGLIALFTHMHIFWIAGLLLAMIDLPDFGGSLSRIAGSAEKIAGLQAGRRRADEAARRQRATARPTRRRTTSPAAAKAMARPSATPELAPASTKELIHA